ncbi:D-alanyl-lipoteichoic acid biosynthesis protein DltD [Clostridium botulinum]|uniref:D-alanyl-lipoteichoic acid biosynthesis protein DltD n=1 Tax=Clostridium botulinum TaxID=1491 RepID=UPI003A811E1E
MNSAGLTQDGFNMNISELQFYKFMFNKSIDKSYEIKARKRISSLLANSMYNIHIKSFSYLYLKDTIFTEGLLTIMIPYYKFKHYLLFIKDKNMDENPKVKNFDWIEEKSNF